MADAAGPVRPQKPRDEQNRRSDERRADVRDRRRAQQPADQVPGWDGSERRHEDRRTAQERRSDERRVRDAVWETDAIDSFWPMDDAAEAAHNQRQAERRDRDRRADERRRAQLPPGQVAGWDGADRREDDRRDLERREMERRIRAARIADGGETPGV